MRAFGLQLSEKRASEWLLAWAQVAGDKIPLAPAMRQPGVLKKTAMDEARRFGGLADRATHAGRTSAFSLSSWQVQHAARSSRVVSASGSARSAIF